MKERRKTLLYTLTLCEVHSVVGLDGRILKKSLICLKDPRTLFAFIQLILIWVLHIRFSAYATPWCLTLSTVWSSFLLGICNTNHFRPFPPTLHHVTADKHEPDKVSPFSSLAIQSSPIHKVVYKQVMLVTRISLSLFFIDHRSEIIKPFSCSTQLSMKFILLINIKMPTTVGILIFISKINFVLSSVQQKRYQK